MCIRNEIVLDFIELVFIVFIFVLVLVDFGFDIEELVSAFTAALSSMTLKILALRLWVVRRGNKKPRQQPPPKSRRNGIKCVL